MTPAKSVRRVAQQSRRVPYFRRSRSCGVAAVAARKAARKAAEETAFEAYIQALCDQNPYM